MIQEQVSLQSFNTFGIAALAEYYALVHSFQEVVEVLESSPEPPTLLLGGGSNMLFVENDSGLCLHNHCMGIEILNESEDYVTLAIGGGMNWHELVTYCLAHDYGGLENLSLIPGTVGAAPVQNIGAYGAELADTFVQLEAVNMASGLLHIFDKEMCRFAYRDSIFKQELKGVMLITKVCLRLTRKNHQIKTSYGAIQERLADWEIQHPSIQDVSRAVITIRQSKLPDWKELGNSGSFFKNPVVPAEKFASLSDQYPNMPHYPLADGQVKLAAGWLIDQAGWRGKRRGRVGSYEKQALVLVNYGGATGKEVWDLAQAIQLDVFQRFNVSLLTEVNVISDK